MRQQKLIKSFSYKRLYVVTNINTVNLSFIFNLGRCYTWGCINEEHNTRRAAEYDGGLESSDLAHYEEKACSEKRPKVTRSKRKN